MPKITKLSAEQEARFPEFVRKWIDIGLSASPADKPRAEAAISGLYRLANLKEPRVIWLPCPVSAALSAVCYAALISRRLVSPESIERRSAVGSAVYSAVGSAVRSAVGSAVRSAVDSAVGSAVYSAVDSAVYSAVYSAVGSAVDSAVYSAVRSAVGSAVYSAVYSAVGSAVRSAVDSAVDSAVYSAVGSAVYSAVGSAVYSAVYSAVDSAVDSAVGSAVRSAVGSAVRSAVDSAVGSAVDSAVDSAVYSAGRSYFGGALWNSSYCAWADYFNEVCGIAIDRNFLEMTESCGFYWTLDSICFASERPSFINRDARGRLHALGGQSIGYGGTGWGLWHWHGFSIPADRAWIVVTPEKITKNAILAEGNSELRRVMCEVVGWPRAVEMLGGKTVARDELHGQPRELIDIPLGDRRSARVVRLVNGTVEDDGTRHEFLEGVPDEVTTPHAAVAWQYGIAEQHYREAVRS